MGIDGTQQEIVVIWVKLFQTETTIKIQVVRPTEVCGKVFKSDYVGLGHFCSTHSKFVLFPSCKNLEIVIVHISF